MLFTFFIAASFAVLLLVSEQRSYDIEVENMLAQQHVVAQLLSNDAASVAKRRPEALPTLAENYVDSYYRDGMLLEIVDDDEVWASRLPISGGNDFAPPEVGSRTHVLRQVEQTPYLFVSARLPQPESMVLTCAFDMSTFYNETENLRRISIVTGSLAVILLASVLYFLLRGLSRPMEQLAGVSKRFAQGEYSARSNYKGRDEVGQLATNFNALAQNVEENINVLQSTANEKQNLVDTLSHEIRTPLTAIKGYSEYLLCAEVSQDEEHEALGYIIDEAQRLSNMCESLLRMASLRGESVQKNDVDLNHVVKTAQRTVAARNNLAGVKILFFESDECVVKGEIILLESLVTNLMDNAVKACGEGGTVTVHTAKNEDKAVLLVKDNGRGMSKEQLKHLGEQFYRPDKARSRQQGGAGLGIALCHQIAKSHGAGISYESSEGVGTSVKVIFLLSGAEYRPLD